MSTSADPYREWDAAYVLGSLSPAERREFELHLVDCPECSAYVTEVAGISGILSVVPSEHAAELLLADVEPRHSASEVPPSLYPRVVHALMRSRRKTRIRRLSMAATGLAVAAAIAFGVVVANGASWPWTERGTTLTMTQTVPSPVTADARLVAKRWGTEIHITCRYSDAGPVPTGEGPKPPFEYTLLVTDRAGRVTEQASWTASPGEVIPAVATTSLSADQISKIEIKWVPGDVVILAVSL